MVIAHFTVASDHNAAGWRKAAQKQKRRIVADPPPGESTGIG